MEPPRAVRSTARQPLIRLKSNGPQPKSRRMLAWPWWVAQPRTFGRTDGTLVRPLSSYRRASINCSRSTTEPSPGGEALVGMLRAGIEQFIDYSSCNLSLPLSFLTVSDGNKSASIDIANALSSYTERRRTPSILTPISISFAFSFSRHQ